MNKPRPFSKKLIAVAVALFVTVALALAGTLSGPAAARALLIESFAGEALDRIEHDGVREVASEFARGWLARLGT